MRRTTLCNMPYLRKNFRIEKRPGPDWVVEVLVIPDNEVYPMSIFGAPDEAAAEREALQSFSQNEPHELRVINIARLDE
jgi:hypothetical protein